MKEQRRVLKVSKRESVPTDRECPKGSTRVKWGKEDAPFCDREEVVKEIRKIIREILEEGWETLPKGWSEKSAKSMWDSLGGSVTSCMKKIDGHVDNPGAFCNSLRRRVKAE